MSDSKPYTVQATWSVAVRGEETWVTVTTPDKEKSIWCEGCAVQEDLFLSKNENLPKGYVYMERDGDLELILSKKDGKYKIEMSSKVLVDVSCEPINSTVKIQKEWPYLVRFDAKCHGTTEPNKFDDTVTHITWQVVDGSVPPCAVRGCLPGRLQASPSGHEHFPSLIVCIGRQGRNYQQDADRGLVGKVALRQHRHCARPTGRDERSGGLASCEIKSFAFVGT